MDFEDFAYYRANGVRWYWGFSTGVSCLFLTVGLIYIVIQYCTQSHLSTEDYESAAKGLKTTRWFKKHTVWLRLPGDFFAECMHTMTFGMFKSGSKSLVWDWKTKDERIRGSRAQIIDGQAPRGASDAQEHILLKEDMQDEPSPINTTAPKGPKDKELSYDTSVHEPTGRGEADIQMHTRKPLLEPLPKLQHSSSRSSLSESL